MFFKKYKAEIIIIALALTVRLIFFIAYLIKFGDAGMAYGDSQVYLTIADNLVNNGHFSLNPGPNFIPDSYVAPGYPFFLAFFKLFSVHLWPVGLVQVILGAATAFFVYRLGTLWSNRIGLIAALLFAVEPTMAFWAPLILTEALFTFLFVWATYLFASGIKKNSLKNYLFCASILGLSALVRPSAQYIFYLFVIFSLIWLISRDWKKCLLYILIFVIIFSAVIAPWLIRNYEAWGKAKLSSAGWYILAVVNVREYIKFWKYFPNGVSVADVPAPPVTPLSGGEGWNFDGEDAYRLYVETIWRANPPAAIAVHMVSLGPFFLGDGYMNILRTFWPEIKPPTVLFGQRNLAGLPSVPFALTDIYAVVFWLGKIFWLAIYLIMLYGIALSLKDKEAWLWFLLFLLIIAAFALPAGAISYARYRMPINYLIFLIFAFGLDRLLEKYGHGKS